MAKKRGRKRKPLTRETVLGDEINLAILRHIMEHPTDRVEQIGKDREVGLEREATQKRINKLAEINALKRGIDVNLSMLGYNERYRVDLSIDPIAIKDAKNTRFWKRAGLSSEENLQKRLGQYVMKMRYPNLIVEDVCVLLGHPSDLSLTIRTHDSEKAHSVIFRYVTEALREEIPGIKTTWTAIEAWSLSRERLQEEAKPLPPPKRQRRTKTKAAGKPAGESGPAPQPTTA